MCIRDRPKGGAHGFIFGPLPLHSPPPGAVSYTHLDVYKRQIFYCDACGADIVTPETIDHVSELFRAHGSNVWFDREAEELLPDGFKCPKCGHTHFTKETDIMDVWFDSGSTHAAVLDERPYLHFPADIYLEGGDQYRGWFQSSMLTSIAAKGVAPYRQIITHGWTCLLYTSSMIHSKHSLVIF